jgi:CO dehydrogenase/acetyl-CoA synthase alpha subunit
MIQKWIHTESLLSHTGWTDVKRITLRGIPEDIEKKVRKEAESKGLSLNKAFLSLLKTSLGVRLKAKKRSKALNHDLDHLSGKWTKEEAETFNRNLGLQRRIDEDLWKKTKS